VAGNVDAQDLQAPRIGLAEPFEHLDRRRLAGAVGAEQPEDLTAGDAERDAIDRPDVAVALADITDPDDRVLSRMTAGPAVIVADMEPQPALEGT
jgi:hypothetical protein